MVVIMLSCDFDDFKVAECTVIDCETDQSAHLMPALQTGSTRIDVQQTKFLVVKDLEDVAVTRNEKLGRMRKKKFSDARVVTAWIAANVCHQDVCAFACPSKSLSEESSHVAPVAVAINSSQWAELLQSHGHFQRTNVAGMPYLVARLKVLQVAVVPKGVGVAKQTDAFHCF